MLEPISLALVASGTFWLLEKTGEAIFSKALGDGALYGACALLKHAETAPSDGNCLLDGFRRAHARTGKLLIERAYRTRMGDTVSARWTGRGPTDFFDAGRLYYEKLHKAKDSENPYDHALGQSPLKLEAPTDAIRAALQPLSNLGTAGGTDAQQPGFAPCLHAVQAFAVEEAVAATGGGEEVRASIEEAFADYAPIFANEIAQEIQDNAPFRAIFNARQLQQVRRDIADLPEAITKAVAQSLGQDLSDLIESLRSQLNEQLESIESLVRGRPDLDAMLSPDSFENRFIFTSRSTPLVGRENELAAFRAWLQSDEKFSWQILAGSGGVGKSRLALELVRIATPLFEAGFYRATQHAGAWHDWRPKQPTLIVVDYPAAKIEATRDLLHQLQRGVLDGAYAFPLRVLLLERDADGPWRQELNKGDVKLEDPSEVVTLSLMENPSSIIRAYADLSAKKAGAPAPSFDDGDVEEELKKLDEEMRPLFAAFLGDAIGRGEAFAGWDKARLVKDVLKRDEERYWPDASEQEKNLAALVTFCRGLNDEALEAICEDGSGKVFPSRWDRSTSGDRIGDITRSRVKGEDWFVGGLEPDLLGELFGLERVSNLPPVSRKEFVATCYRSNARYVTATLMLCHRDWPDHEALPYFDQNLPKDSTFRRNWAQHCFGRIFFHGQAKRLKRARQEHEKLTNFVSKTAADTATLLSLAMGSVNLIIYYGQASQIDEAKVIFESLKELQERFPDNQQIALQRAMGGFNLIIFCGDAGQIGEAKALFESLKELQERFPDNKEIALRCAKGYSSLIIDYSKAGQIDEARELFESLKELQERFLDNEEIALQHARGCFDLIVGYGQASQIDKVRAIFESLNELQKRFPDNEEIAIQLAKSCFNLMIDYGKAGQIDAARAVFEGVLELQERFRDNEEIQSLGNRLVEAFQFD